jgi:hypothetical protein
MEFEAYARNNITNATNEYNMGIKISEIEIPSIQFLSPLKEYGAKLSIEFFTDIPEEKFNKSQSYFKKALEYLSAIDEKDLHYLNAETKSNYDFLHKELNKLYDSKKFGPPSKLQVKRYLAFVKENS